MLLERGFKIGLVFRPTFPAKIFSLYFLSLCVVSLCDLTTIKPKVLQQEKNCWTFEWSAKPSLAN